MTEAEWITVAAIIVGPVASVAIALWIEKRRKARDARLLIARLLLITRDFPSDPNFQSSIKIIPLEFDGCNAVLSAHREFLDASNVSTDGKAEAETNAIGANTDIKLVRLVYEVCRAVGLKIRETDIQTSRFGTRGFFYRDNLLQDSQRAMRDIATILAIQTKLLGQNPVTPQDEQLVNERLPKTDA